MAAQAAVEDEQVRRPTCWCCGNTFDEQDLSRLGSHPEVGVCAGCAQWLHRRARSTADARRSTHSASGVDRGAIVADLTACGDDLRHLLAAATPAGLRARTNGTRWSNEQLLFHMVFGFLVVRRLLPLVRLLSSLPPWVGRAFALLLDAGRVPFHWINYAGSCAGALVFNRVRMGWLCDRTIDHLVASLEQEPEQRLVRGMPFPTSWDPYFEPFMSLADVYAYPVLHFAHHRAQLTLTV